jgi:hypothetical protein
MSFERRNTRATPCILKRMFQSMFVTATRKGSRFDW